MPAGLLPRFSEERQGGVAVAKQLRRQQPENKKKEDREQSKGDCIILL